MREHSKKLKNETSLKGKEKYSFPYKSVDKWNSLKDEIVKEGNVHLMKESLDKYTQ